MYLAVMAERQTWWAGHSQRLFGMARGLCMCHLWEATAKEVRLFGKNWRDALRRQEMHMVGGGSQELRAPCRGSPPVPTGKCECAWGVQGQTGTPCSPT